MERDNQGRFGSVTEQQLQRIVDGATPQTTQRTTRFWLSVFNRYCEEKKLVVDLAKCTASELNDVLKFFYVEVRNAEGKTYQRSSLCSLRAAIQRHLKDLKRPINIFNDKEFDFSNAIFNSNIKHLHQRGQLLATQHKPALGEEDLAKALRYFYDHSNDPVNLLYATWFFITLHLGLRGKEVQGRLQRSDFDFITDATGVSCLKLSTAFSTKNHQATSAEVSTGRITHPQQLAIVKKLFDKMNPNNDYIFQRARDNFKIDDKTWYVNSPLGHNTLANMMRRISKAAGLSMSYSNHSVRATTCTVLKAVGFSDREVATVSGHRNLQSLSSYSRPTEEQRIAMSSALDNYGPGVREGKESNESFAEKRCMPAAAASDSPSADGSAAGAKKKVTSLADVFTMEELRELSAREGLPVPPFCQPAAQPLTSAAVNTDHPTWSAHPADQQVARRGLEPVSIPDFALTPADSSDFDLSLDDIDALVATEEAHELQQSLFDCGNATFSNCTFNITFTLPRRS